MKQFLDKTFLKFVAGGLVAINLGVWGFIVYGPRWDVKLICKAYSEFSQDKKTGVDQQSSINKLVDNLDSLWTRQGENVARAVSMTDPLERRKLIEQAGYDVGIRFWSCPGVGFE